MRPLAVAPNVSWASLTAALFQPLTAVTREGGMAHGARPDSLAPGASVRPASDRLQGSPALKAAAMTKVGGVPFVIAT